MERVHRYLLDRLVLRPTRDQIDHRPQQRVMLRSANHPLECFVRRNHREGDPPEVLILKFPGTAGRAERSTDFPLNLLPRRRVSMWTWNPPGYGGSGGKASLERMAEASIHFWESVLDREAEPETPVLLCGNSLGCAAALRVAANATNIRSASGLVLRNPPPLTPVVKHVARRYPLGRFVVNPIANSLSAPMNAIVTASQVSSPAIFLQSELDTLVPPALQQQVIDAYAGEKRTIVLKGLAHGSVPDEIHEPDLRDAIQWLWSRVTQLP